MTAVTSKPFGITLWISFEDKFTSLVNNDVRDWASLEAISNGKGAASREMRFALEPERQVSNTQMRDPGASNQLFINGEAEVLVEKTVTGKQLDIVGEFDYDVYLRAAHDISLIYTGPMAKTLSNMAINAKETFIKQYYGDGTGVVVSNTSSITVNTTVSITLGLNNTTAKYGCPYWVQEGMKLVPYSAAGVAHDSASSSSAAAAYYLVTAVNHTAATMTMTVVPYTSAGVVIADISNAGTITTDDVWYNYSDESNGGIAGNLASISDYGNLLYAPGLQAWGRDDGKTTYGVVHSGAYAGTNIDKGGGSLMFTDIGDMFAMGARRTGEGKYDYPTVKTSLKTWKYLIDLDEGSKELRPVNVEPSANARGGKKYMYFYNDIASELVGRRFVPDFELWAEPKLLAPMSDGATGEGPLQFKFTGFDFLSEPESNQHFRFKITSSGRHKVVQAHMTSFATFICSQSASLLRVKNFILS